MSNAAPGNNNTDKTAETSHTTADLAPLLSKLAQWLESESDPADRDTLLALGEAAATDPAALQELRTCLGPRIAFGTAGIRGKLQPGPAGINTTVIRQTAAGLAEYLIRTGPTPDPSPLLQRGIVVGFDARHRSQDFAHECASIFARYGWRVWLLPGPNPTPMVPWSIRELQAAAGIMITASHNPADDNGVKVYLEDGRAIITNTAEPIMAAISRIYRRGTPVPAATWDEQRIATVPDSVLRAYQDRLEQKTRPLLLEASATNDFSPINVVYTPMHGVGYRWFAPLATPWARLYPVPSQQESDGNFPTTRFPNPEAPEALAEALAHAQRLTRENITPELILAHDPDADRCAVAVPGDNGWQALTGNELGLLLGWWLAGPGSSFHQDQPAHYGASVVSSPALATFCDQHQIPYSWSATGFKWISRIPGLSFGYEEAIGFCVDPLGVADKDGLSAGVLFLACFSWLKQHGRTCWDVFEEIQTAQGIYRSSQRSWPVESAAQGQQLLRELARHTHPVWQGQQFQQRRAEDIFGPVAGVDADELLIFEKTLDSGWTSRMMVRASGTEPKVKVYLHTCHTGENFSKVQQQSQCELVQLEKLAQAVREQLESSLAVSTL